MKTKIVKIGVLALATLLPLGACDDYLDTTQRGVTSQDAFYQTDNDAYQALMAIYYGLKSNSLNEFQMNILSDDAQAGGGSRSDNNQGNELNEFTFSSSNSILSGMFTTWYQTIYKANVLLKRVADDTAAKKLYRAEAKGLRAYCYFQLVSYWGAVPLVLEPLEAGNYNQPNSTVAEIYAQIEQDLKDAMAELPAKSQQSAADKARFSKGAAQSLLGKAYLFQKKYAEAAAALDEVIKSNEYSLYPDFAYITRNESEFGVESIFELNYVASKTEVTQGTAIAAYCGPRSPWFKAGTTGITESGWGWVAPEMGLHDAYVVAGDQVRGRATVLSEDELINEYNGSYRAADGSIPYGTDGLVRVKYGAFVSEFPDQNEGYHVLGATNFRLIRYADVLLMAAEAHNRAADNDALARGYVNQVRARVNLPALPASLSGDNLFEAIKLERRLELAFENARFRDLVRWGDAATVLKDSGKKTSLGTYANGVEQFFENPSAGFKANKNELMPFPETEITVNPNIKQNQGY